MCSTAVVKLVANATMEKRKPLCKMLHNELKQKCDQNVNFIT